MTREPDIAIVGAGVAGAALAVVLARRGVSVLLLEKQLQHVDRVLGESVVPWGVEEARRLGLLDILLAAGGHFVPRLVLCGEGVDPDAARERAIDLGQFFPGVPGTLKIGHPALCRALCGAAEAAGAVLLSGVSRMQIEPGPRPVLVYNHRGAQIAARPRLIVGADGRGSIVARQIRASAGSDTLHHIFGGLLVDGADGWPDDRYAIGTEGRGTFYIFPQGGGRFRLYFAYGVERRREFAGPDGARNFLGQFRLETVPGSEVLAAARPAGPCRGYPNADSWIDRPMAPGVVLIGDAAGHNDPTIGQGISIAFRDVSLVAEALFGNASWSEAVFEPYAEERRARMARLRIAGREFSRYRCEYSGEARARRAAAQRNLAAEPGLAAPFLVPLAGPDILPAETYEATAWDRLYAY